MIGRRSQQHPQPRIINGHDVTEQERYPWFTALAKRESGWVFCGASLIHPRWVLTAHHCTLWSLQQLRGPEEALLQFAATARGGGGGGGANGGALVESRVPSHSIRYDRDWRPFDFALISWKEGGPVVSAPAVSGTATTGITPVSLYNADTFIAEVEAGRRREQRLTTIGLGRTDGGALEDAGELPSVLQEVAVEIVQDCEGATTLRPDIDLCVLAVARGTNQKKKATCYGDSGGPLFFTDDDDDDEQQSSQQSSQQSQESHNNSAALIGVLSRGTGSTCSEGVSIYSRLNDEIIRWTSGAQCEEHHLPVLVVNSSSSSSAELNNAGSARDEWLCRPCIMGTYDGFGHGKMVVGGGDVDVGNSNSYTADCTPCPTPLPSSQIVSYDPRSVGCKVLFCSPDESGNEYEPTADRTRCQQRVNNNSFSSTSNSSSSSSTQATSSTGTGSANSSSSSSLVLIAAVSAVGGALLLVGLGVVVYCCCFKRRAPPQTPEQPSKHKKKKATGKAQDETASRELNENDIEDEEREKTEDLHHVKNNNNKIGVEEDEMNHNNMVMNRKYYCCPGPPHTGRSEEGLPVLWSPITSTTSIVVVDDAEAAVAADDCHNSNTKSKSSRIAKKKKNVLLSSSSALVVGEKKNGLSMSQPYGYEGYPGDDDSLQ